MFNVTFVGSGEYGSPDGFILGDSRSADGPRNVGRREAGGSDLVQQRLKQMKVAPVDHGDMDWHIAQRAYG
jgi:hypothetical protein